MFAKLIKKISVLMAVSLSLSTAYITTVQAQEGGTNYLQIIAENTTEILARVNDLPNYLVTMVQYALNMQKTDDSQSTTDMQANFATTGSLIVQNAEAQLAAQPSLAADLIPNASRENTPFANDVVYSTLLGQPLYNPDPRNRPNSPPSVNPPLNYIKNASGISVPHSIPNPQWRGNTEGPSGRTNPYKEYAAYYNTMTAGASFNGYVLSNQLAELQNGNGLTTAQTTLVTQASNSDWIAQIAAEEIGKVLRQILMFESQTYVLMTQLLKTQKELLTAQVINNGLLIASAKGDERSMLARAQGVRLTQ